jgi:hypothetical protein
MDKFLRIINKSIGVYEVRGLYIEPTYWQVAAIVFLIFLMLLTLARMRYLYVHWHMGKQNISMLFWGFLFALLFEGVLVISGRTMFSEILGWKNAPKPISTMLDITRNKLVDVLGITDEIPTSNASEIPTLESVMDDYQSLSDEEKDGIKNFVCKPNY